ncbi:DUF2262 domain-containing protein [Deinococcus sp. YIM 134068]|uniref:DUF2262 domain-containing protein n=1 Tax=Deinococcus lichenicola TaxID=3118910 RepID=UPI002F926DA0
MDDVHVPGLGTFHREERRTFGGPVGGPHRELVSVTWEARVNWRGEDVTLTLDDDETRLTAEDIAQAGQRLLAFLEREPDTRREVATAMLDLAEDWWAARDDEESETLLTLERFLGLMRLDAVVAESDGLTVYYDDDEEIFAGHAIQATFDAAGNLADTDIPG